MISLKDIEKNETFAFGADNKVHQWCRYLGPGEEGNDKNYYFFSVINGAWSLGMHKKTRKAKICRDGSPLGLDLIWRGIVPDKVSGDFNLAIRWIDKRLKRDSMRTQPQEGKL